MAFKKLKQIKIGGKAVVSLIRNKRRIVAVAKAARKLGKR